MDIVELERRTHEQIRDIQEECRQRIAPLVKILTDIHGMKPFTFTEEGGVIGRHLVSASLIVQNTSGLRPNLMPYIAKW